MKNIWIFLLITCNLFAQNMEGLLDAYEKASDHSYKTKDESAGNLIVYTRDTLDRMQAQTLKDLLKGLRMHQYVESRTAQPDPFNRDPMIYNSMPMRIYLNGHEMLSSLFGSGMLWFGDMELDFIDHVEIYQGMPSLDIATEPAQIIIRLYSKTAEHDEGGRLKLSGGSYGSNMQNLYYTQSLDEWSYFVYAGHYDDKRETHPLDAQELSRDKNKAHLFGSIETKHHRFEIHALQQKSDDFLGVVVAGAPLTAQGELSYYDLSWQARFFNDSLHLNATYSRAKSSLVNEYSETIVPNTSFTKLDQEYIDETLTLGIKKEWKIQNHTVTLGTQYREKYFNLSKLSFNDVAYPFEETFDTQEVISVYIQDHYDFNANNLLTLSFMYQDYSVDDKIVNEDSTNQLRAGYTYVNDGFVSKTALSYQEYMPEPYMMGKSFQGNPDLKPSSISSLTQEFSMKLQQIQIDGLFAFAQFNDSILYLKGTLDNFNETMNLNLQNIRLMYEFSQEDSLECSLSRKQRYVRQGMGTTLHTGLVRMLNSINKFDIFNEFVMHEGYATGNGIDYSAGVRYHINQDVTLSIKGENIFNSGLSWEYMTHVAPEPEYLEVPTIDRKVTVGLEWLF